MENFHTIYNENNNIRDNKNAWNYYFKSLNKFTLNEVYKSKNVLITDNKFFHFFSYNIDKDLELSKLLGLSLQILFNSSSIGKSLSKLQ